MAAEGVERIVVADLRLAERNGEVADGRHDQAHDDGGPGLDEAGCRGDDDQAGDKAGCGADERGLAHLHALDDHPGDERRAGGDHGVDQSQAGNAVSHELGAGVEAEPAEPQKGCAQGHERHVMRTVAHHAEALALTEHEAQDQAGQAGGDMHDVAAGEVERADGVADKAAVAAPNHVGKRRIHHDGPHRHERTHRAELHTTGKGARDDGGGDHAERHLEDEVDDRRIRGILRHRIRLGEHVGHAAEEAKLIEASEERAGAVPAVCQRPTADRPRDRHDADG